MSETIDAIQEKLSFSNISEQVKDEVSEHINSAIQTAKDSVYDATLGKVGNVMNYVNKGMNEVADTTVMKTVGKNPLAIGLIGLGLGLLYMNRSEKRSQYRYNPNKTDYDFDREGGYQRREFSAKDNQSTFATAQSKVSDTVGSVSGTVSDAAGAVSDTVSDVAGKAYEQVGNLGSQVKDVAGSAQDQYEYYMDENPLAVGAVALALGAAVGMSIPSTRFEGELMGETRDNLVNKAQATARDTIDKVQQVAGTVTETVKQAAGDVIETVKESAGDAAQTVKVEAKKQGLT
jgi:gas vesicle protein